MKQPKRISHVPLTAGMNVPATGKFLRGSLGRLVLAVISAILKIKVRVAGTNQYAKVSFSPETGLLIDLTQIETGTVGTGSDWRFAAVGRRYDPENPPTALNEATVVTPNNEFGGTPGLFVLVQLTDTIPVWPPTGMTEAEALNDPDDPRIFWWPIILYCR